MKKALWVSIFIFIFLPNISSAVPITHGFIKLRSVTDIGGTFNFGGADFDVSGWYGNGAASGCAPCPHNSDINMDLRTTGNDIGGGGRYETTTESITVNWGDLNAAGPSILDISAPAISIGSEAGIYTGSFSFTGSLCGTVGGGRIPAACEAWLPSLEGTGIVSVVIAQGPSTELYIKDATYNFVTPEPSTIFLLCTGIAGIAGWSRRKYKMNH